MTAAETYKKYADQVADRSEFGFSKERMATVAPILGFLYESWWKVCLAGLDHIPQEGPAMIVGNTGGVLPLPAVMLLYALMKGSHPRRLNILAEMGWVEDERLYSLLTEIGFVPWSSGNAKKLFAAGEVVAVFPEGLEGAVKPFGERYRLRSFDWTRLLPAIEEKVPIIPMATLGCDESIPVLKNLDWLAGLLDLPAFPITPLFPLLPFPASLIPLPVRWNMRVLKPLKYDTKGDSRDVARDQANWLEGEIQAELNRMIRARIKSI